MAERAVGYVTAAAVASSAPKAFVDTVDIFPTMKKRCDSLRGKRRRKSDLG
jgi:hypothetical protein